MVSAYGRSVVLVAGDIASGDEHGGVSSSFRETALCVRIRCHPFISIQPLGSLGHVSDSIPLAPLPGSDLEPPDNQGRPLFEGDHQWMRMRSEERRVGK